MFAFRAERGMGPDTPPRCYSHFSHVVRQQMNGWGGVCVCVCGGGFLLGFLLYFLIKECSCRGCHMHLAVECG